MKNYSGIRLYGLEESLTDKLLQHAKQLVCLSNEWSNESRMKQLFDFHLRKRTMSNIDWYSIFCDWQKSNNPIIELHFTLANIYPVNYIFSDRELRAWHAMLKACGCTKITPFKKEESKYEFWSKSKDCTKEKEILAMLYNLGFLRSIPITMFNATETFWKCFARSLDDNKKGSNGKRRILSIIADQFSYQELQNKLQTSFFKLNSTRRVVLVDAV